MSGSEICPPEIYNVIVGTAGHIDHGKSSLVRHLTGIDPDRLPEERDRGLTIDLGFAPLELSTGERVGIIDVPGHERFIKNMVAGASGIDLVVLVVAADDSVMPQTREHLDIMTLLGVARGLIVINKVDLVEEEMVDLVEEELEELTFGTFLEGAPMVRTSASTGQGIDAFRAALEKSIHDVPRHSEEGIFRLPIQRVFSSKGHGTVVTGIPVSGHVQLGDRVEILPLGETGRVRGLQAYKQPVERARAGHSTAMNLGDVDYRSVHRGMVAATPGYFRATQMIDARVRVLPHVKIPLRHQMSIRFHAGTAEVIGRMFLLEAKAVHGGEETFVQFRLEEPVVVAPGDRFVFRQETPMLTLGGGEVLDRSAWRLKTGKDYVLESLRRKEQALGSQEAFLLSVAEETPFRIVTASDLARSAGLPDSDVSVILLAAEERGDIITVGTHRWITQSGLELGRKRVLAGMDRAFVESPYRIHVTKLEVRDGCRLDREFFEVLISNMEQSGDVATHRGGKLSLPGRKLDLSKQERRAYAAIQKAFEKDLFAPPSLADVAQAEKVSEKILEKMRDLLVDQELFARIASDLVLSDNAIEEATRRLRSLYAEEGPFSASRAKDALGTSRKFAIPLLEYMDSKKITRRVGDSRELIGEPSE